MKPIDDDNARLVNPNSSKSQPQDEGWAWVIVFASFMIFFVAGGASLSFGVFFVEIVKEFEGSKTAASFVGSILLGCTYGAGPLVSIVINKYGCRVSTTIGAIVSASGFTMSYFVNNLFALYITLGVFGGVGLGFMYLPAIVCLSMYFDKKRALATGIGVCGAGVGTSTLAPFYHYLVTIIGWRRTLLAVAGSLLSCIAFGALFKPLESDRSDDYSSSKTRSRVTTYGTDGPGTSGPVRSNSKKRASPDWLASNGSEDYRGSTVSSGDSGLERTPLKATASANKSNSKTVWRGLSLLSRPMFLIFAVSTILTNMGESVPYVYIADVAKEELALDETDPNLGWLISSIGISNTISRVLIGFISDRKCVNRLYLYSTLLVLCGFVTASIPIMKSITWIYILCALFGSTFAVYACLSPVILGDILGVDLLSDGLGIILLCQALGALVGPPIVGAFFDYFQKYIYGFSFTGLVISISGILVLYIPILQRMSLRLP